MTGNAWNLTANLTAIAEHKAERWIFGGKAFATYGESRAAGSATGSRRRPRNAGLFLRGDDRFTRRLSGYLLGGIETKIPWDTTLAVTLDYLQ